MGSPDVNTIVVSGKAIKVDSFQLDGGKTKATIWLEVTGTSDKYKPRFTVTGLGDNADRMLKINPDDQVLVQGQLSQRSVKDKNEKWQSYVEIFATKIVRFGSMGGAEYQGDAGSAVDDDDVPF